MRLLFEIDKKDYLPGGETFIRPSARAIIINDGKIAMIFSMKNGYYKLPGGGIKPDENAVTAMIREVREETGLTVISDSVREYGYVHRIQKGKHEPIFIQDNYYYICNVEKSIAPQELTDNEIQENFILRYVEPTEAIRVNKNKSCQCEEIDCMIQREVGVLEMLNKEGFFK